MKKYIFLNTVIFITLITSSPVYSECNMMLIADSYAGGYLIANPQNRVMGCDFYNTIKPTYLYAGGVAKWYYEDSVASTLDVWKYAEASGALQDDLYSGADYVFYAIGKNDTGIMLNCEAYDSINQLVTDHENFISNILIDQLEYRREQIILFFSGPVAYSASGDIEGDTVEDCRPDGISDNECVLAHYEPVGSAPYGWRCPYANRHLKLVTAAFGELAREKGMPFADMFTWVVENYQNPDEFFAVYDSGDGLHPDISINDFEWWDIAVQLIEEATSDVDGDGIYDDGDFNGVPGDNPCTGGNTVFCDDNCPLTPNGSDNGSCVIEFGGVVVGTGVICLSDFECGDNEYCQMEQGDSNNNGTGDACECYSDFNDNSRIAGGDMFILVDEANKSYRNCDPDNETSPPCCYADANGNGRIDGGDMFILVEEANASKRNCSIIPHCPNVP